MPGFDSQQLYKDSCKLMTLAYEAQFCMTNAGYTFREMQDRKYNIQHSHHYDTARKRARTAQA